MLRHCRTESSQIWPGRLVSGPDVLSNREYVVRIGVGVWAGPRHEDWVARRSLDAHCQRHAKCTMNRTLNSSPQSAPRTAIGLSYCLVEGWPRSVHGRKVCTCKPGLQKRQKQISSILRFGHSKRLPRLNRKRSRLGCVAARFRLP